MEYITRFAQAGGPSEKARWDRRKKFARRKEGCLPFPLHEPSKDRALLHSTVHSSTEGYTRRRPAF